MSLHTLKQELGNPWGHAESSPNGNRGTPQVNWEQTDAVRSPEESVTKPEKPWTLPCQAPFAFLGISVKSALES